MCSLMWVCNQEMSVSRVGQSLLLAVHMQDRQWVLHAFTKAIPKRVVSVTVTHSITVQTVQITAVVECITGRTKGAPTVY